MREAAKSSFNFEGFKVVRSVIERKEGDLNSDFKIHFNPKGKHYIKDNLFELTLETYIKDESDHLSIEVITKANYKILNETKPELLRNFFFLNAPAILFPYIRAYISALTTLSGLEPITLPTLNLTNLAEDLEKNTTQVD